MKLPLIRTFTLRIILMSIVGLSIISFSIMSFAKKYEGGMVSVKGVENTSDVYGESVNTRELISRIDDTIVEVFKILHSDILVENPLDVSGESVNTRELVSRMDDTIAEVFKILHSDTLNSDILIARN